MLLAGVEGLPPMEMIPVSENEFLINGGNRIFTVIFKKDGTGAVTGIRVPLEGLKLR